ncbi:MAG: tol-pal system protein YbgF [Deltaproteobacteria bacterium]|nr:tol-pal system protein YbgF [Deltaproteobacteria bacterium]
MRAAHRNGRRPAQIRGLSLGALLAAIGLVAPGCATQGDLLRLEEEVTALKRTGRSGADPFARIAQLSSDVDVLRQEVRDLQGELELARKEAADALAEVRKTRTAVAQSARAGATGGAAASDYSAGASEAGGSAAGDAGAAIDSGTPQGAAGAPGDEVASYQKALDTWRKDDFKGCIDQFTGFLQVYPSSSYSDDAAYWLADCTFSNKEYKRAVVRFNAVVNVYPDSPKAPDALYRQGESLLKLGPKFHEAARTVFKRVEKEYPDSPRAAEAKRQLSTLGREPA